MKDEIVNIQSRVFADKFPKESWAKRGLIPSNDSVIVNMNADVNKFIRFLNANKDSSDIETKVIDYFEDWERGDFDTEEMEFIFDVYFELLTECTINTSNIMPF